MWKIMEEQAASVGENRQPSKLKVFELFCGIGGMHWALQESGLEYCIKRAVDINTVTNSIYRHNFPEVELDQREIQSLSAKELDGLEVNTVLMSPPCQPFTRVGKKKDSSDPRTSAFLSLLDSLAKMTNKVTFLLIENVQGFESSETRECLINFLQNNNYIFQEFLLTPLQFSIPNSRLRYYCIARHSSQGELVFSKNPSIMRDLPEPCLDCLGISSIYIDTRTIDETIESTIKTAAKSDSNSEQLVTNAIDSIEKLHTLQSYLEMDSDLSSYTLDDKTMTYYEGLDIRKPISRNSCCFTKRYGHYYVGSSFLDVGTVGPSGMPVLRFFTPKEISRLLKFPDRFDFPADITRKQRYRALGNSLNVYVVSLLIKLMVFGQL